MKKTVKKKVSKSRAKRVAVQRRQRRTVPPKLAREIDRRFDFVDDVSTEQADACIEVRAATKRLAQLIGRQGPLNRERALALTKLEEALSHGIAAIVRPSNEE